MASRVEDSRCTKATSGQKAFEHFLAITAATAYERGERTGALEVSRVLVCDNLYDLDIKCILAICEAAGTPVLELK